MALAAADVVARARVLWPQLTVAAAPQTTALAWVPMALQIAGDVYLELQTDAAAHALAHCMYRLDPAGVLGTGGGGSGAISSIRTGGLSVGYHGSTTGRRGSDADL